MSKSCERTTPKRTATAAATETGVGQKLMATPAPALTASSRLPNRAAMLPEHPVEPRGAFGLVLVTRLVSIATTLSSSLRPTSSSSEGTSSRRLHTSRMAAHSVADRRAIR